MNADIEQRPGIVDLAAANPLNSACLASTLSISRVLRRLPAVGDCAWPGAGEDEQVVGEHPQSDPPLHSAGASVAAPPQSVTAFECADASFAAGAPAERGPRGARARLPRLARQDDVPDA